MMNLCNLKLTWLLPKHMLRELYTNFGPLTLNVYEFYHLY